MNNNYSLIQYKKQGMFIARKCLYANLGSGANI